MAQEIIDKYTRSLYNILNIDEIEIWEGINFGLPEGVDTKLKALFESHYMYYEIGQETIARWLDRLKAKVEELSYKYNPLFTAYATPFTDADIYANNTGDSSSSTKFYATPQTQIGQVKNYLTTQNDVEVEQSGLNGMTKADARENYIESLRVLEWEYIQDCKDLFMGVM